MCRDMLNLIVGKFNTETSLLVLGWTDAVFSNVKLVFKPKCI